MEIGDSGAVEEVAVLVSEVGHSFVHPMIWHDAHWRTAYGAVDALGPVRGKPWG